MTECLIDNFFKKNVNSKIFHGFFKRNGGVSKDSFKSLNCALMDGEKKTNVIENRKLACKKFSINPSNLVILKQIHSNKIIEVNKNSRAKEADGMISKDTELALGILTADCAPMVFSGQKYYGIIHLGWRGLFKNIISNLVRILKDKKEDIPNVYCSVGPHLNKQSFEIKKDFIELVRNQKPEIEHFISFEDNKYFFDFSGSIKNDLIINGFKKINISSLDTFSNNKDFFSYRFSKKQNEVCGRQISLIGKYK